MKRTSILIALALLAGCGSPRPSDPTPAAADPLPAFGDWPTVTPGPVPVELAQWVFCRPVTPDEDRAARERHGPHFRPAVVVRVSPGAADAFRAGRPLPVGAVVVKEKHPDEKAEGKPAGYAAMVKREAGYDPGHGDWEYVYVDSAAEPRVTRGRLTSCIDCHSNVKDRDYLFRTYLPKGP